MVIETFRPGKVGAIYARLAERGRMMPPGVEYVDSWIDADMTRCFQLVDCSDESRLRQWVDRWADLADFEIVPVISSAQAQERASGS